MEGNAKEKIIRNDCLIYRKLLKSLVNLLIRQMYKPALQNLRLKYGSS